MKALILINNIFRKYPTVILFFILIHLASNVHATDCSNYFRKIALTQFKQAPTKVQTDVLLSFKKQQAAGTFEKKIETSNVKRVTSENLQDLATMTEAQVHALSISGLEHIEELAVITSGAGLWSRGGGSVKALVPYNVSTLLGADFLKLSYAGKIVAAKNSDEILKIAKVNTIGMSIVKVEAEAKKIKDLAMISIKSLLDSTIYNPKAINTLDMKFANLATIYEKTGKYVSLDIWTSEQTHQPISEYLIWLTKKIDHKTFHPDATINLAIKKSLKDYFAKSQKMGESHLFGYQEGLQAIDTKTGKYKEETASIGKGAGAIIEYLEKSGRMNILKSQGKKTLVFENIEVVSDYVPLFASHRQANKAVSVVLVPQREGYVGGSPFMIKQKTGDWNLELLEQSVLSDEFKSGNKFFNTNTIFFSSDIAPPQVIGFELKEQNTIARVKQNMGDITLDNTTHGIGGRLGHEQKMIEYENFKSYDDYGDNGNLYIQTFQRSWKEILQKHQ